MDQFFGNDEPKKKNKKVKNEGDGGQNKYKNKLQNDGDHQPQSQSLKNESNAMQKTSLMDPQTQQKRQRKDRAKNKKKKQEQKKMQEAKKPDREQLELPLVIKIHRSLIGTDDSEMNLQEFIDFMYPQEDNPEKKNRSKIIRSFEKEDDEGNIQYKLKLIKPTDDRLDHLATQMKFRLGEGFGQAYYRIGVEDDGKAIGLAREQMYESLKTICTIANKIHADITAVRVSQGIKGNIAELMVTKNQKQGIKLQIRLLLIGESNSGKSTLLGVIKSGEHDDGKGYSRTKVFTHKDQFMSGITQTKSHHIIAFDSKGKLFNHRSMMSIESWLQNSSKILSFIDVGGHKEKQVVSSLCSFFPEYALWVVSGINKTVNTSCIELAKIFHLPLIVVITHLDKLDKEEEMDTVMRIKKTLKELYPEKAPSVIKEMENAVLFSRITSTEDVIPIFLISSVSGKNLDLLINFFNLLTSTSQLRNNQDLHAEFLISNKFTLQKSIVLAGTVIKGTIKKGQILHLGPDNKGSFRAVEVESIECMRVPVKLAKCGQVCTIGIKLLSYAKQWIQREPNAIRRGMVLIESKSNPKATHQFTASFIPYSNQSQEIKITAKYQPVINTLTTRQICDIIVIENNQQQLQLEVEGMAFTKKKSKSIDTFEQKNKHHNGSLSSAKISIKKNTTFTEEKVDGEQIKVFQKKKQSQDLTCTYKNVAKSSNQISDSSSPKIINKLSPIIEIKQEGKLKKKKVDRDNIEIKFNNHEPTTMRLRFKYYPEFLENGQKLVINELKLIGQVTQLHY